MNDFHIIIIIIILLLLVVVIIILNYYERIMSLKYDTLGGSCPQGWTFDVPSMNLGGPCEVHGPKGDPLSTFWWTCQYAYRMFMNLLSTLKKIFSGTSVYLGVFMINQRLTFLWTFRRLLWTFGWQNVHQKITCIFLTTVELGFENSEWRDAQTRLQCQQWRSASTTSIWNLHPIRGNAGPERWRQGFWQKPTKQGPRAMTFPWIGHPLSNKFWRRAQMSWPMPLKSCILNTCSYRS